MEKDNSLPVSYEVKAGTMNFFAGRYKGKSLVSWDIVGSCPGDTCPAYARCPYDKKDEYRDKCIVQLKYVKSAANMVFKNYAEVMSPFQLYSFGMHVMPLFAQLIKLKLIEVGIPVEDIVIHGKKWYIHPVFKEIRDTIKAIYANCKEIGISPATIDKMVRPDGNGGVFDLDQEDYVTELMGKTNNY